MMTIDRGPIEMILISTEARLSRANDEARERLRALGAADVDVLDDEESTPGDVSRHQQLSYPQTSEWVWPRPRRAQAILILLLAISQRHTPQCTSGGTMRIDLKWRYSSSNIVSAVPTAS